MFKKFGELELEHNNAEQSLRESGFYCSVCLAFIASSAAKIEKQGAHQHICTNPAHQTFRIGCFRDAPGCTILGSPTGEHTWFPGYYWSIALCDQCKEHLGWKFAGGEDCFHGLILNKVVET